MPPQAIYLARHGETEWALEGRHTGHSDIPLTAKGEQEAQRLGERLQGLTFTHVLTSPLQRARRTAELAGWSSVAMVEPDLFECNYVKFEGWRYVWCGRFEP